MVLKWQNGWLNWLKALAGNMLCLLSFLFCVWCILKHRMQICERTSAYALSSFSFFFSTNKYVCESVKCILKIFFFSSFYSQFLFCNCFAVLLLKWVDIMKLNNLSFNLVAQSVSCQSLCFQNFSCALPYISPGTMKNIYRMLIC